jgi:acyl-CoA thioester hydrolase
MLSPSAYLRYMQEAAFDASAAVGYDVDRYQAIGRTWLIRQTDIRYLGPLRHNDVVEVTTWVADFQRVRSRRAYEFRKPSGGDLVASATTDWAFLETATGHPAAIPTDIMTSLFPEGAPVAQPRRHLPTQSPPPGAFRMRRKVEWADLDPGQHVNNARFLALVDECAIQATAAARWPPGRLRGDGLVLRPRRHEIEYLQPGLFGQQLHLASWPAGFEADSVIRSCVIHLAGDAVLVRARSEWVCCDIASCQPVPMPQPLRRALRLASPSQD